MSKWTGKETVKDKKVFFSVGFRSDVMKHVDKQCEIDGISRRQAAENLINAVLDEKGRAIIDSTHLPMQEVVIYLLQKTLLTSLPLLNTDCESEVSSAETA